MEDKKEIEEHKKAIKEFEEKMEKHRPQGHKHFKLFKRLTWSGLEIDWTRILEFSIFALVMVITFGVMDWVQIQQDRKILDNQDIIKQNQLLILNAQSEKRDMIMNLERQHKIVLNILLTQTNTSCSKCHKLDKSFCKK